MNFLRNFLRVLLVLEIILGINGLIAGSSIADSMFGFICMLALVAILPTVLGLVFLRGKQATIKLTKTTIIVAIVVAVLVGFYFLLGYTNLIGDLLSGDKDVLNGIK